MVPRKISKQEIRELVCRLDKVEQLTVWEMIDYLKSNYDFTATAPSIYRWLSKGRQRDFEAEQEREQREWLKQKIEEEEKKIEAEAAGKFYSAPKRTTSNKPKDEPKVYYAPYQPKTKAQQHDEKDLEVPTDEPLDPDADFITKALTARTSVYQESRMIAKLGAAGIKALLTNKSDRKNVNLEIDLSFCPEKLKALQGLVSSATQEMRETEKMVRQYMAYEKEQKAHLASLSPNPHRPQIQSPPEDQVFGFTIVEATASNV